MANRSNHHQVFYKPLANLNTVDETNLEIDGDEDEIEVISACKDDANDINDSSSGIGRLTQHKTSANHWRYFQKQHGRNPIGLRQFRTILLAIASVLLIIFILKLATYEGHSSSSSQETTGPTNNAPHPKAKSLNSQAQAGVSSEHQPKQINVASSALVSRIGVANALISGPVGAGSMNSNSNIKPKYDNYLSSIIYERDHKSDGDNKYTSDLLDDFKYSIGDERLPESSKAGNKWWSIGVRNQRHVTIANYIRAMKSFNYNSSVTLATHLVLKSQSFHHVLELCKRWDGPISVAIFLSSGLNELPVAVSLIKFVRLCLPAPLVACMRDKLTWSLVFTTNKPDAHKSLLSSLSYPKYHLDTINYSSFADTDQCPKFADLSATELVKRFQADIIAKNNNSLISSPNGNGIGISSAGDAETPVNVLRNIARNTANTKYVLVTNVDLYPSVHLAGNFNELINSETEKSNKQLADLERCIFPLPAFEVELGAGEQQIPKTKRDLVELSSKGKIRPYREAGCDLCHEFSRQRDWLNSTGEGGGADQSDKLAVFETIEWTRSGPFTGWSPFFLAQNTYRNYNENLLSNERIDVMYEMCLLNYRLVLLDDGFLIRLTDSDRIQLATTAGDKQQHMNGTHESAGGRQSVEAALSSVSEKYKDKVNTTRC
jgi:hypothetical protein